LTFSFKDPDPVLVSLPTPLRCPFIAVCAAFFEVLDFA
jgi:hypothetical protein